jgi:hypothetical protein
MWDILKGQHVMLIKWENFGAFYSDFLGRKRLNGGRLK